MSNQSYEDLDSQNYQFEKMFQEKLGEKPAPRKESSSVDNLHGIVDEIIKVRKSSDSQKPRAKPRAKWTKENTNLFFKLYQTLSGDLDMITQYFEKHHTPAFTKQQIKKKYNQEMKTNPDLFKAKLQNIHPKIAQKFSKLAKSTLTDLPLDKQQSMMSLIESPKRTESKDSVDMKIHSHLREDLNKIIIDHNKL